MADSEALKDFLGIPRKLIPWFPTTIQFECENCRQGMVACLKLADAGEGG